MAKKTIKVRAEFPTETQYGFYGTQRRYNGNEFDFNYDNSRPLEDQLGTWMKPLRMPKAAKVEV